MLQQRSLASAHGEVQEEEAANIGSESKTEEDDQQEDEARGSVAATQASAAAKGALSASALADEALLHSKAGEIRAGCAPFLAETDVCAQVMLLQYSMCGLYD
jgi:hypothetical protein